MTICLAYGRGKDLDGDVTIAEAEGSQPTKRVLPGRDEPAANQLHGLPDADPGQEPARLAGRPGHRWPWDGRARWLGAPGVS